MTTRILLAEDDDAVRSALTNALTRSGFDVVAVDDGGPAIELAETHVFDIVLVDLNMKTVGGIEVVRFYKKRYGSAVTCIVLSGEDDGKTRTACNDAGVSEYMLKPVSPSVLRCTLAAAEVARRLLVA